MAQNVTIAGASYADVPSVELPKTGGGTAVFVDPSPTTAVDSDVASGKIYFKADGTQSVGTSSGGGGSSYTLVTSKEVAVSTTSSTATKVLDISGTFSLTKFVYVCVRDKAGKRNGYFYGSDTMFLPVTASGAASTRNANRRAYYVDDSGNLVAYSLSSATSGVAGVYATNRTTSNVEISSGYSSSNTRTIDGTYTVSVYEIDYPTGLSPF